MTLKSCTRCTDGFLRPGDEDYVVGQATPCTTCDGTCEVPDDPNHLPPTSTEGVPMTSSTQRSAAFEIGDQVHNVQFGRGEVVKVYRFGLLVEFLGGPCHHLLAADLTRWNRGDGQAAS